jgi:hypothetical protein
LGDGFGTAKAAAAAGWWLLHSVFYSVETFLLLLALKVR